MKALPLLLALLALSGCATRRPAPPRPQPQVRIEKAQVYASESARHVEAARETLHHQGDTIRSILAEAEAAELANRRSYDKTILYLRHSR